MTLLIGSLIHLQLLHDTLLFGPHSNVGVALTKYSSPSRGLCVQILTKDLHTHHVILKSHFYDYLTVLLHSPLLNVAI
jgi:hypothetical protein